MDFVGEEILTRKKTIFELEDVEKCEQRADCIKSSNGQNHPTTKWYVTLKDGQELLINVGVYNEIKKYKK